MQRAAAISRQDDMANSPEFTKPFEKQNSLHACLAIKIIIVTFLCYEIIKDIKQNNIYL